MAQGPEGLDVLSAGESTLFDPTKLYDFVLVEQGIGFKLGGETVEGQVRVVFRADVGTVKQAVRRKTIAPCARAPISSTPVPGV